jgi:hypothetical protein
MIAAAPFVARKNRKSLGSPLRRPICAGCVGQKIHLIIRTAP